MKTHQLLILSAACLVTVILRVSGAELTLGNTSLRLDSLIALSLLCGAGLRSWPALLIPLGVRLTTDVIIELKTGHGFWPSMWLDYAAYAAITIAAIRLPARRWSAVLSAAVAGPLVFFAVSNFGVWALWPDTYARNLSGLIQCYSAGLPFFRGSFAGNVVFCGIFFAGWNAVVSMNASSRLVTAVEIQQADS